MAVIGLAVLLPSAEGRDAVIKALRDAVPKFHAEVGCELYALHESGDEIVIIEKFSDMASLDLHANGEPLKAMRRAMKGLVEVKRSEVLNPLPMGGDAGLL
jgi:quinol monooxygenase YgiN